MSHWVLNHQPHWSKEAALSVFGRPKAQRPGQPQAGCLFCGLKGEVSVGGADRRPQNHLWVSSRDDSETGGRAADVRQVPLGGEPGGLAKRGWSKVGRGRPMKSTWGMDNAVVN